jgi:menaquinol-cytochrome c reductase iron-sulfur subunit
MSLNRREFASFGTFVLGGLMSLVLAVPGAAYLLDPVLKGRKAGSSGDEASGFTPLARLADLVEGIPQSFPVLAERQDAWVKYPKEAIGSVWLIRQPEGSSERVVAFSAECPHLGCGVNLAPDKHSFACPCHSSSFSIDGKPTNVIPPRPMDRLDVKLSDDADPEVLVRFQRFRSQAKEQIPLA